MNPVRIAVIGAGHLGKIHARLLKSQSHVELLGIVDPDEAARLRAAAELEIPVYGEHRQLLNQVDAAVIAAPTYLHHAIGMELLERGIHVLMEKPLAENVAQAGQLVRTAADHQVVLQVGHVEQFNPALLAVRDRLVPPSYVEAVRTSSFTFRSTDIGVVLDLMIHDVDLALSLVQSTVTEVHAVGLTIFGPHEDIAQARLTFANGCIVNLTASRVSHQTLRTLRLFAPEQLATIDFGQGTATLVHPAAHVREQMLGIDQLSFEEKLHYKERLFQDLLALEQVAPPTINAIQEEQRAFLASIRSGEPVRVDGQQALQALIVAEHILHEIAATQQARSIAASRVTAPLSGPHWHATPARFPDPRRQAG